MMRGGGVKRGARVVVVVVVLSIVWLQLALPPLPHDPPAAGAGGGAPDSLEPDPSLQRGISTPLHTLMQQLSGLREPPVPPPLTQDQIWEVWEQLLEQASSEIIMNLELYGPVQHNTVVIVVQVHNRLDYLRHLIVSLAEVRNIDAVLLIFSHDYFDENINKLIMTIDFCKVLQVFYPHPLQLHPIGFPGHTQGDCPRDTNPKIARQLRCRGNPDLYGHYREPRYTQTKHHWWWKANKVFESVLSPLNHTGLVLFLEEDHYVSEDLLHMLALLAAALPHACPHCSLLTLGNYIKNYNWPGDAKKVEISPWLSSKHNMGFAFNRSTWLKIQECGSGFCTHDDYNWDWSLQHVSNTCLKNRLYTMVLRAPRVFHIGECGVHHKKKDCSSKLALNKVYRTLHSARRALFPLKLIIMHAPPKKLKKHKGNGGWGDHRDQELCKSFLSSTGVYNPLVLEPQPLVTPSLSPQDEGGLSPLSEGSAANNKSGFGSGGGGFNSSRGRMFPNIHPKAINVSSQTGGQAKQRSLQTTRRKMLNKVRMSVSRFDEIDGEQLDGQDRGRIMWGGSDGAERASAEGDEAMTTVGARLAEVSTPLSSEGGGGVVTALNRRDLKVSHARPPANGSLGRASRGLPSAPSMGGLAASLQRQARGPGSSSDDDRLPLSKSLPYYIDPRNPLNPHHHHQQPPPHGGPAYGPENLAIPDSGAVLSAPGSGEAVEQRVALVPGQPSSVQVSLLLPPASHSPARVLSIPIAGDTPPLGQSYVSASDPRSHRRSVSS